MWAWTAPRGHLERVTLPVFVTLALCSHHKVLIVLLFLLVKVLLLLLLMIDA